MGRLSDRLNEHSGTAAGCQIGSDEEEILIFTWPLTLFFFFCSQNQENKYE